jgi:hypothetical protein
MTSKWLPIIACAAAIAAARAQSVEPEVCGYVYNVQGSWRVAPQYAIELKLGMAVHVGDKIQLKSSARPAHLDIGLVNGKLFSQDCDSGQKCEEVTLPAVRHENTFMERLSGMLSGFAAHQPPPVFTLTRGDGPHPEEAVLRRTRGMVDLAPALPSTATGTWDVTLVPAGEGRSAAPVTRRRAPHGAYFVEAPKDGLYRLQLSAADAPPAAVLVLIVGQPEYAPAAATFADAMRLADSWGQSVRPATRHYFLSLVLNALSPDRVY